MLNTPLIDLPCAPAALRRRRALLLLCVHASRERVGQLALFDAVEHRKAIAHLCECSCAACEQRASKSSPRTECRILVPTQGSELDLTLRELAEDFFDIGLCVLACLHGAPEGTTTHHTTGRRLGHGSTRARVTAATARRIIRITTTALAFAGGRRRRMRAPLVICIPPRQNVWADTITQHLWRPQSRCDAALSTVCL